jgi:hypothetical protein
MKYIIGDIVTDKQILELGFEPVAQLGIHITKIRKERENYLLIDYDENNHPLDKGSYRILDQFQQPTEEEVKRLYFCRLQDREAHR